MDLFFVGDNHWNYQPNFKSNSAKMKHSPLFNKSLYLMVMPLTQRSIKCSKNSIFVLLNDLET